MSSKETGQDDIAKRYKRLDIAEHIRSKSMWIGSSKVVTTSQWIYTEGRFAKKDVAFPPGLYKIFDEILVNAIDQYTITQEVKNIRVSFDRQTGRIVVSNDGRGIPVSKHPEIKDDNGNLVWIPHLIFFMALTGTNFSNDASRKTGGTNGVGSKLANLWSEEFTVETYDYTQKLYFRQTGRDRMRAIEPECVLAKKDIPPEIVKEFGLGRANMGFTRISFIPSYKDFNFTLNGETADTIAGCIHTRCFTASAFTPASVYFNGEKIPVRRIRDMAPLLMGDFVCGTMSSPQETWDIVCGISDGAENISVLNGISPRMGGTHITYIQDCIFNEFKTKVSAILNKQKITKSYITNHLFIMVCGELAGLDQYFSSQDKESFAIPASILKKFEIPKVFYTSLWKILEPHLNYIYLSKLATTKGARRLTAIKVDKYNGAEKAGTAESHRCMLFVPEGDSAETCVMRGIRSSDNTLSFKYCGFFNLKGVPVNSRKHVTIRYLNNKKIYRPDPLLLKNERITAFEKVLNLNRSIAYTTDAEMQTLRYGCIVLATDQDIDGIGQISSLVLNHFALFFPNLLAKGFIKRLATPIIRAYPKSDKEYIEEFYSEKDYESWKVKNFGTEEPHNYRIKYFKGLAGHEPFEVDNMFAHFDRLVCEYTYNPQEDDRIFECYFGKDTDPRKTELRLPLQQDCDIMFRKLPCRKQLDSQTKAFQLDNIYRHMLHIVDGLKPGSRKVLAGALKKFVPNNEIKVFQLAGFVAEKMAYHHGDASLNSIIINLGQTYVGGGHILPLLKGKGEFGTRDKGGKDSGQPRYISVKLNKKLTDAVFPKDDMYTLRYVYTDGVRVEPEYFVPVIPMAILNHYHTTSTGWKIDIAAREIGAVIARIRACIAGNFSRAPLPIWTPGWYGSIRTAGRKTTFRGCCEVDRNKLTITEIPYSSAISTVIDKIKEYAIVKAVSNRSSNTQIRIVVDLALNWEQEVAKVADKYGTSMQEKIEYYFKLVASQMDNINYVDTNNKVIECRSYNQAFDIWFEVRKAHYIMRVERLRILLRHKISYYKNIIRYCQNYEEYGINELLDDAEADRVLLSNGYSKFNKQHLFEPAFIRIEQLEEHIYTNASFDYIYSIPQRELFRNSQKKITQKLAELEAQLAELTDGGDTWGPDYAGAKIWLKELETAEEVISHGLRTSWNYSDKKPNFKK